LRNALRFNRQIARDQRTEQRRLPAGSKKYKTDNHERGTVSRELIPDISCFSLNSTLHFIDGFAATSTTRIQNANQTLQKG